MMSTEGKASSTTTCVTDTDDGDYETSSEGLVRGMPRKLNTKGSSNNNTPSVNFMKMGSNAAEERETEGHNSEEEISLQESSYSQNNVCLLNVVEKSESLPVLKSTSMEGNNDEDDIMPTSESSLARERKMKMIVARLGSRLCFESDSATNALKADFGGVNYETKKIESQTLLPVLRDTKGELSNRSKEVTFGDVSKNRHNKKEKSQSFELDGDKSRKQIAKNSRESQEDDDLIDIAENPHASIKSFYFPPNPQEREDISLRSRKKARVTKDLEALLRIDGELGPLQHQLSEITGKFRALNLTDISINVEASSLRSQKYYFSRCTQSSDTSGYYLHRADTFGRDSMKDSVYMVDKQAPACTMIGKTSEESKTTDYFDTRSIHPFRSKINPFSHNIISVKDTTSKGTDIGNDSLYSLINPGRTSNVTSNWLGEKHDSCISMNSSFFQFSDRIGKDTSASLIPCVSSSCYKCHKNRSIDYHKPYSSSYFDEQDIEKRSSNFAKGNITDFPVCHSGLNKSVDAMSIFSEAVSQKYQDTVKSKKSNQNIQNLELKEKAMSGKLFETLYNSSTNVAPQVHVISMNTELCATVEEHYANKSSGFTETSIVRKNSVANPVLFKTAETNFDWPKDQNVSTSFTVIGPDESNKTQFLNCTQVNSQTSLIISKKDQSVETSNLKEIKNALTHSSTRVIGKNDNLDQEVKKELQDLNVHCSAFNLKYHQKEIVLRQSMASILKPSESDETNTSKSGYEKTNGMHASKIKEKIVIVPILFTDGVPEPLKVPCRSFTKSKSYLSKTQHHKVKLQKRVSSLTQSSMFSEASAESCAMKSSYLNRNLMSRNHWNSRMSVSCVSRDDSQLSNTIRTLPEYCHKDYGKSRRTGSIISGSIHESRTQSEPTKRKVKSVIRGMRSSPEDFLYDT